MKNLIPTRIARWSAIGLCLAGAAAVHALPVITGITEISGGEANKPVRWTGVTFNHPNLGANYLVKPAHDEMPNYNDRVHQLTGHTPGQRLHAYLVGGEHIMNANDARDNMDLVHEVTVNKDVIVYLLIDNRNGDGNNANPPTLEVNLQWVIDAGFQPVLKGGNRTGSKEVPDEAGIDEAADGAGPGAGLNQWFSIYSKVFPAGTFQLQGNNLGGQNMWTAIVKPVPEQPFVAASAGTLNGFNVELENGSRASVNQAGLVVRLNGTPVTPGSVTQANGVTAISYTAGTPLPSGSTNTVSVEYGLSTGGTATNTFDFIVEYYATLTAAQSVPAASVNTAASGFTARVAQFRTTAMWPGNDLPNTIRRAEEQLAGILIDPTTGRAVTNYAVPGPNGGAYVVETINWNQEMNDGGNSTEAGNFQTSSDPSKPDAAIPGIPGTEPDQTSTDLLDNIATEFVGYLQLQPGLYRFGVNSDDGFRLTAGADPHGAGNVELGSFNGGRGSADSLFYVRVMDAGIYPVRLIWFEGGGGANIEFFSMDATGKRTLINDRAAGGINAYASAAAGADAPDFVVTPYNGETGVWPTDVITAKITDRSAVVNPASVVLKLNGQTVPTQATKVGGVTTLTFDYPGNAPANATVNAEITYADQGTPAKTYTQSWSFKIADYSAFAALPAAAVVPESAIDKTSSGFKVDVYQTSVGRSGFTDNNSNEAAERHIARGYIDESTGQPYENMALPGTGPNGTHIVPVINWSEEFEQNPQRGGFTSANGTGDTEIPGVESGDPNNIVAEAFAYLQLKAGVYQFGVNSDDGFKVTTGTDAKATNGPVLGIFNTGRGAADTLFSFVAPVDGFFPFRLLWWEGSGDASAEFFSVDPVTGYRTLINSPTGIKAYWKASAVAQPRITGYTFSGGNLVINYTGGVLESTMSLQNPTWSPVGNANGSTHTENVSLSPRRFFRVRAQ
ncbi:MAG TPA: hypothetical protein VEH27_03535 [Methylomirabilota bacterium]|nr:hypothetical protein [Methylomirabilota bacterium]